jgi:Regulator of Vps4 activity in the MVB pathway
VFINFKNLTCSYCRECPLDLKEAISSICFAAPRCADLPELMQIQMLFAGKYGKEFVVAASELLPDCGVNRQVYKFSEFFLQITIMYFKRTSCHFCFHLIPKISVMANVHYITAGNLFVILMLCFVAY